LKNKQIDHDKQDSWKASLCSIQPLPKHLQQWAQAA